MSRISVAGHNRQFERRLVVQPATEKLNMEKMHPIQRYALVLPVIGVAASLLTAAYLFGFSYSCGLPLLSLAAPYDLVTQSTSLWFIVVGAFAAACWELKKKPSNRSIDTESRSWWDRPSPFLGMALATALIVRFGFGLSWAGAVVYATIFLPPFWLSLAGPFVVEKKPGLVNSAIILFVPALVILSFWFGLSEGNPVWTVSPKSMHRITLTDEQDAMTGRIEMRLSSFLVVRMPESEGFSLIPIAKVEGIESATGLAPHNGNRPR